MPSIVQKKSLNSVTIFWFKKDKALRILRRIAKIIGKNCSGVLRVGLFGSIAKGTAVPGSDADILIILDQSQKRIMDRYHDFIQFFKTLDIDVDIFCYTLEEIDGNNLAGSAYRNSIWLYVR